MSELGTPIKSDPRLSKATRKPLLRSLRAVIGLAGSAILVIILFTVLWLPTWRRAKPATLTISGGSEVGIRHSIADSLERFTRRRAVHLSLSPTVGSQEALQQVNAGQLDLALVQGGLNHSDLHNIRQVAVLHFEPLHLLLKPEAELASDVSHYSLSDIAPLLSSDQVQLRINIGKKGSGTHSLATDVLNFFGLNAGEHYEATYFSYQQLMSGDLTEAELPDIVFTVSSLPSPVAKALIVEHGYRPVEMPMADAFRIDWAQVADGSLDGRDVVRRYIEETTIPASTYQVSPPVPDQPIKTLGTRLQLVAHVDTPDDAIERVVDAIYDSSFATVAEPTITVSLLQTAAEYDLHDGAKSYLEKKAPIITEQVVELTEQLLAIFGTVCGALLFVWQAILFARRRRRDRQFLLCIERVSEIEHRMLQYDDDDSMTVDTLSHLQNELSKIKADLVQQFQSGDIDGADTLSSFLMHINDANRNLTILRMRAEGPDESATRLRHDES